jgi:hypothetical protein
MPTPTANATVRHHTTQQEIQQSEQHVASHDMKEGRSYERTGRGADRWFLC